MSRDVFDIYGPYGNMIFQWFESKATETIIARMDGQPVGFTMIGQISGRHDFQHIPELLAIAVEPEKQGMGIGNMLLNKIEKKASELNIKGLVLHTATENIVAQRLFSRNGYKELGIKNNFYPEGQDAIMMFKEILEESIK